MSEEKIVPEAVKIILTPVIKTILASAIHMGLFIALGLYGVQTLLFSDPAQMPGGGQSGYIFVGAGAVFAYFSSKKMKAGVYTLYQVVANMLNDEHMAPKAVNGIQDEVMEDLADDASLRDEVAEKEFADLVTEAQQYVAEPPKLYTIKNRAGTFAPQFFHFIAMDVQEAVTIAKEYQDSRNKKQTKSYKVEFNLEPADIDEHILKSGDVLEVIGG